MFEKFSSISKPLKRMKSSQLARQFDALSKYIFQIFSCLKVCTTQNRIFEIIHYLFRRYSEIALTFPYCREFEIPQSHRFQLSRIQKNQKL
jgi:hypothetical protein